MNKRLLQLAAIVLLLSAVSISADAQGFFKKLGNALSKVDKALSNDGKSSSKSIDNFVNMQGVTFNVLKSIVTVPE